MTIYEAHNPSAALILAHGAGAGQASAWMVKAAQALAEVGVTCVTFDFPYITNGRKVPDKTPVLEAHWRKVLDQARARLPELTMFIGGKSMGGRIASHIAAQGVPGVRGLVFFGYPLHPPGRPEQRRDAHLRGITCPMLFVQGSADAFGNEREMSALIQTLSRATLHLVAGGDHSLNVRGGASAQRAAFDEVIRVSTAWMRAQAHPS